MDTFNGHGGEDPVVIVGMACRYPGEARSPEQFFDMVSKGRSAHCKVPSNRFNIDSYYHPSPDRQGALNVKGGYYLKDDPAMFDAPFFSMTANEAAGMDPMQRLMLEVAYESLENAGIPIDRLPGSKMSCYVGCFTKDYEETSARDIYDTNPYQSTGNGRSMLSNRVSWFFDLAGPSMTLDTACSSSLYALHLAYQSLMLGESDSAIVGGTNIILAPDLMRALCMMRFLSPDGQAFSFDSRANGYARGEGIGAVVLKRLSSAIADGDSIRAVIRASGINQDGKTPGITMPSAKAQAELIRSCYSQAGLDYNETAYFEAHGTGTQIGDPIELSSLGSTFGVNRDASDPLWVSSAKTNIGHQEGGAGLAGLIRAVLCVEKGFIPPLAGFEKANPQLKLDEWKLALPTDMMPWPKPGVRRASVNSFGYGGANSHVIIDDAYHYLRVRGLEANHQTKIYYDDDSEGSDSGFSSAMPSPGEDDAASHQAPRLLFAYSALDQSAVQRLFVEHASYVQQKVDGAKQLDMVNAQNLGTIASDLAHTLSTRRTIFDHRSFVVADGLPALLQELQTRTPKTRKITKNDNLVFAFTGQGAQYSQQGKALMHYAVFRDSLVRFQASLEPLGCKWDVVQELLKPDDESQINSPAFSQPLCTALQLAQIDLLSAWGVKPKSVIGHSSGEIAAAYATGAISHEDAAKIAYWRGLLSADVNRRQPHIRGTMMAVGLSAEDVAPYLEAVPSMSVVVACINSPESVTLSGDSDKIAVLEADLKAAGVFARQLKVQTAYHSPHMRAIADDYLTALQGITPNKADSGVRMFSSVTSSLVAPQDLGPSYWVDNMLRPVQFSDALKTLMTHSDKTRGRRRPGMKYSAVLELGPHAALKGPISQLLSTLDHSMSSVEYTSLLSRGQDAQITTMEAMGKLWTLGCNIDIALINNHSGLESRTCLVDLPNYPWNHTKLHWHESQASKNRRQLKRPRTDLLGVHYDHHNASEPRWRNIVRVTENPWLLDHKIQNTILFPGAGMLVMALEAAQEIAEPGRSVHGYTFRDVNFTRGLVVPNAPQSLELELQVRRKRIGTKASTAPWYEFTVYSLAEGSSYQDHCSGLFTIDYETETTEIDGGHEAKADWKAKTEKYADFKSRLSNKLVKRSLYKYAENMGLQYGPLFRCVDDCMVGLDECHGSVTIPDTKSAMPAQYEYDHLIHPTTLDNIFQMQLAATYETHVTETLVPVSIEEMFVASSLPKGAGAQFFGYADGSRVGSTQSLGNVVVSDTDWLEPKIVINNFRSMGLSAIANVPKTETALTRKCTHLEWVKDMRRSPPVFPELNDDKSIDQTRSVRNHGLVKAMQQTCEMLARLEPASLSQHMQRLVDWTMQDAVRRFCVSSPSPAIENANSESVSQQLEQFPVRLSEALRAGRNPAGVVSVDISRLAHEEAFAQLRPATSSLFNVLRDVVRYNPNASILLVSDGGPSAALATSRHLATVDGSEAFARTVITEPNEEALGATKATLKAEKILNVEHKMFDPHQTASAQDLDEGAFDIIVAPPSQTVASLTNLRSLLRESGSVLLCGNEDLPVPSAFFCGLAEQGPGVQQNLDPDLDLQPALEAAGFVRSNVKSSHRCIVASGLKKTKPSSTESAGTTVTILKAGVPTPSATELENHLTTTLSDSGFDVKSATLEELKGLNAKAVVSTMELSTPLLASLDEASFDTLKMAFQNASSIVWLTSGAQCLGTPTPASSLATGMLRVLRAEAPQTRFVHLDLARGCDIGSKTITDLALDTIATALSQERTDDLELAEKDGDIYVPRLMPDEAMDGELAIATMQPHPRIEPLVQGGRPLNLTVGTLGMLDSLHWIDDVLAHLPMLPDEVEIQCASISLNFRDIMVAMGQLPSEKIGGEAAGIVTRVGSEVTRFKPGQRVITVKSGAFRTHIRQRHTLVQPQPELMTASVAASCPIIYMTAINGLIDIARLQPGESILIHAAAGGLGQAAIQLAQWIGAEIYVTVSTQAKKKLLMDKYGIAADHVFSSRDLTFAPAIMRATKGKGVDVVLNSLAGEALRRTWLCIADFGRFIEVGKRDILGNTGLDMSPFLRQATFASVNLEHIGDFNEPMFGELLRRTVELLNQGVIGAVHPITEYPFTETEKAFRLLQTGKHLGKVVLTVNPDDTVPVLPPKPKQVALDPDATYVLSGGLGGVGRSIAEFMFDHGASHIVFVSRSGASKPDAQAFLDKMTSKGRKVDAFSCDTTDPSKVDDFARACHERGWNIKGLVQCAMVLRDSTFDNMTFEDWVVSTEAKVNSTRNLHEALPKELDFFIMLSSMSGVLGSPGQANYAAGNTFLDAFAHWRRSQGWNATSIDLGVVGDIGYVAENSNAAEFEKFEAIAPLHINEQDLHMLLSATMLGHTADGNPVPAQVTTGIGHILLTDPVMGAPFVNDPKFGHLLRQQNGGASAVNDTDELREAISGAESVREAAAAVLQALVAKLAKAIMVEAEEVDVSKPLHAFGVDSLVAVEIRNWIFRELKSDVSVFDILAPTPMSILALRIASKSTLMPAEIVADEADQINKELEQAATT